MSNICKCPNPPGGTVSCGDDQIAVCRVQDGNVEGFCIDVPKRLTLERFSRSLRQTNHGGFARLVSFSAFISEITVAALGTARNEHVALAALEEAIVSAAKNGSVYQSFQSGDRSITEFSMFLPEIMIKSRALIRRGRRR